MKSCLTLLAASLLAGCSGLAPDRLFDTGRDARVFNPQTGRYEWPEDAPEPPPAKRRVSLRDEPPASSRPGDEREFNPQSGRYEMSRE